MMLLTLSKSCRRYAQSNYLNNLLMNGNGYCMRYLSTKQNDKPRVLFVCVANSCRSQLAEALGRRYLSDVYEVHSAGSTPSEPNPLAIEFLQSKGYDTSMLYSKSYADIPKPVNIAIALCEEGDMECNSYFDASILERRSWSQIDPVKFEGSKEEKMEVMETVYHNIKKLMIDFKEESLQDLTKKK